MEQFKGSSNFYRPLRNSEIRVVRLKPSVDDLSPRTQVEAKLCTIALDSSADFFALSYVWGDANTTVPIKLDGHEFPVTINLYIALANLRNRYDVNRRPHDSTFCSLSNIENKGNWENWPNVAMYWWIDAICINQRDNEERAKQIPRIKDLYARATRVVIWITPAIFSTDYSEAVQIIKRFPIIGMLAEQYAVVRECLAIQSTCDTLTNMAITMILTSAITIVEEKPKDLLKAMGHIFLSPSSWFQRIWTLQEAVFAKEDPALVLGSEATTLSKFCLLQDAFVILAKSLSPGEYLPPLYLLAIQVSTARKISLLSSKHSNASRQNTSDEMKHSRDDDVEQEETRSALQVFAHELLSLLSEFGTTQKATNKHDKIYGLLGLTSLPDLPHDLKPNYDKPFGDICMNYSKFLIQSTGFLTTLHLGVNKLAGYPSWVPDFSMGSENIPRGRGTAHISPDGRLLSTRGVKIGEAIAIHLPLKFGPIFVQERPIPHDEVLTVLRDFVKRILKSSSQLRCRALHETAREWVESSLTRHHAAVKERILALIDELGLDKRYLGRDDNTLSCTPTLAILFGAATYMLLDDGTICSSMSQTDRCLFVGDVVVALHGTASLTHLRPYAGRSTYRVLGECNSFNLPHQLNMALEDAGKIEVFNLC